MCEQCIVSISSSLVVVQAQWLKKLGLIANRSRNSSRRCDAIRKRFAIHYASSPRRRTHRFSCCDAKCKSVCSARRTCFSTRNNKITQQSKNRFSSCEAKRMDFIKLTWHITRWSQSCKDYSHARWSRVTIRITKHAKRLRHRVSGSDAKWARSTLRVGTVAESSRNCLTFCIKGTAQHIIQKI